MGLRVFSGGFVRVGTAGEACVFGGRLGGAAERERGGGGAGWADPLPDYVRRREGRRQRRMAAGSSGRQRSAAVGAAGALPAVWIHGGRGVALRIVRGEQSAATGGFRACGAQEEHDAVAPDPAAGRGAWGVTVAGRNALRDPVQSGSAGRPGRGAHGGRAGCDQRLRGEGGRHGRQMVVPGPQEYRVGGVVPGQREPGGGFRNAEDRIPYVPHRSGRVYGGREPARGGGAERHVGNCMGRGREGAGVPEHRELGTDARSRMVRRSGRREAGGPDAQAGGIGDGPVGRSKGQDLGDGGARGAERSRHVCEGRADAGVPVAGRVRGGAAGFSGTGGRAGAVGDDGRGSAAYGRMSRCRRGKDCGRSRRKATSSSRRSTWER